MFISSVVGILWWLAPIYRCAGVDAASQPAACNNLDAIQKVIVILIFTAIFGICVVIFELMPK